MISVRENIVEKVGRMLRILFLEYVIVAMFSKNIHGTVSQDVVSANKQVLPTPSEVTTETNEEMLKYIENIETIAAAAEKSYMRRIIPLEDTERLYDGIIQILEDITESMKDVNNAYKFLKAKGIERVISSNFMISYSELRTKLLVLLKVLFEVTPTTTNAVIPNNVVDRLLDIFENDDNLALKAHALDILYLWLPNNPVIQARVMQLKGLEPFYHQVSKLDVSVIDTLLDLFNNILNEHLKARNEKIQKTKADLDKLRLYQRIGLVERMSTLTVCNGLLNIFEVAWTYNNNNENNLSPTLFEIIKNIKPFCLKQFKGKAKAIALFDALLKFVKDPEKMEYILSQDMNITETQSVIEDYVAKLKYSAARDEF